MLRHGHNPDFILEAVSSWIPKNSEEYINWSDTYRGIAISSALGTVLDLIITSSYTTKFSSHLQLLLTLSHPRCAAALKEITFHSIKRDSNVYVCSLDATKVFDKVKFVKLF